MAIEVASEEATEVASEEVSEAAIEAASEVEIAVASGVEIEVASEVLPDTEQIEHNYYLHHSKQIVFMPHTCLTMN